MGESVPNDSLIGHRLAADQAFASQLHASEFTTTEWDLIMSVVEFEIDQPGEPEAASLEAVAEDLPKAIDATAKLPSESITGFDPAADPGGESNLFERLTASLGLGSSGGSDREDRIVAAQHLIDDYAGTLEHHLRERGAWAALCDQVAED